MTLVKKGAGVTKSAAPAATTKKAAPTGKVAMPTTVPAQPPMSTAAPAPKVSVPKPQQASAQPEVCTQVQQQEAPMSNVAWFNPQDGVQYEVTVEEFPGYNAQYEQALGYEEGSLLQYQAECYAANNLEVWWEVAEGGEAAAEEIAQLEAEQAEALGYSEGETQQEVTASTTTTYMTAAGGQSEVTSEETLTAVAGLALVGGLNGEVGVRKAYTHNLGNYESVRFEVSISVPSTMENVGSAYDWANAFVDAKLQAEIEAVQAPSA